MASIEEIDLRLKACALLWHEAAQRISVEMLEAISIDLASPPSGKLFMPRPDVSERALEVLAMTIRQERVRR